MKYIYLIYGFILVLLLVYNVSLIRTNKKTNQMLEEVQKMNLFQTKITNEYHSQFKRMYNLIGNKLDFYNSHNNGNYKNDIKPVLIIKENTCGVCKDELLMEIESMMNNSIEILKDMEVILLNDKQANGIGGIKHYFTESNIPVKTNDLNCIESFGKDMFPDMCLLILDNEHRIISCCEFNVNLQSMFKIGIHSLNNNYNKVLQNE